MARREHDTHCDSWCVGIGMALQPSALLWLLGHAEADCARLTPLAKSRCSVNLRRSVLSSQALKCSKYHIQ